MNYVDIKKLNFENDSNSFLNIFSVLPVIIYWKNNDGKYLGCNQNFINFLNLNKEKIIGKSDFDLPWKDSASHIKITDDEVIHTKRIKVVEEEFYLQKNYKYFLTKKIPLVDNENFIGLLCISFDITDTKLNSKKVSKQDEYSDIILEHITSYMDAHFYWKNTEGVYVGCNDKQAKSLGYQKGSDVIGKTDFDICEPERAMTFRKNDIEIINSGVGKTIREIAKFDGKDATVLSQKVPLKNKEGKVIGLIGISSNISNEIEAEKKLKRAIVSKSDFFNKISHDLRTPLNNIRGYSELAKIKIKKGIFDTDEIENYFQKIIDVVENADNLISNSVELYNLDEKTTYEIYPINLEKNIEMLISSLNIPEKVSIDVKISKKIPKYIRAENRNLFRVLFIIINNSIRFSKKDIVNNITISINNTKEKKMLEIEISDTGIGISKEQLKNLFNTLLPSDEINEKAKLRNTGLKIVIAKKLIESIGGKFIITSKENIGTKVKMKIPFEGISYTPSGSFMPSFEKEKSKEIKDLVLPQFSILLVEDDLISLNVEAMALEELNQKVTTAESGDKAIELINKNKYDFVFVDINLSDADGFEIAKKVKKKWGDDVNIVAVTSHTSEEMRQKVCEHGIMTLIPKPASYLSFREFLTDYVISSNI